MCSQLTPHGLEDENDLVAIRNEFPEAKIIILTTYESDVQGAMRLGARAYLPKSQLDRELLPTIRAVQAREYSSAPLNAHRET